MEAWTRAEDSGAVHCEVDEAGATHLDVGATHWDVGADSDVGATHWDDDEGAATRWDEAAAEEQARSGKEAT